MMRKAILVLALASSAAACSGADETELLLGGAELVEPDVIERVEVEGQVVEFIDVAVEGEDGSTSHSVMVKQISGDGETLITDRMRQAEGRALSPAEIYLGLTGREPAELPDELVDHHALTGRELTAGRIAYDETTIDKQFIGIHGIFFPPISGREWIRERFETRTTNANGTFCGEWESTNPAVWKQGANVTLASTCPAATYNEGGWLRIAARNQSSPTGDHTVIMTLCYGPSTNGTWACFAPFAGGAFQNAIYDWDHPFEKHMAYGSTTSSTMEFGSGKSIED